MRSAPRWACTGLSSIFPVRSCNAMSMAERAALESATVPVWSAFQTSSEISRESWADTLNGRDDSVGVLAGEGGEGRCFAKPLDASGCAAHHGQVSNCTERHRLGHQSMFQGHLHYARFDGINHGRGGHGDAAHVASPPLRTWVEGIAEPMAQ